MSLNLPTNGAPRARSASVLVPSPSPPPREPVILPPTMLQVFASRVLDWGSSPKQDADVLPLSAAPTMTSFPRDDLKIPATPPRFPSAHVPMLLVMLLFPLSTALVLLSLTTLPITVSWPHTLPDLAQLGRELLGYSQSGPAQTVHVIAVLSLTAIWKHAWSVPGSVIWNVLAGALFSPAFATILMTTLTTLGSACATLLAMPLGPLITRLFPRALDVTRNVLEGSDTESESGDGAEKTRSSAWVRLSVMRLIGIVPWSGINIACGVCGVSIWDCMLSTFIGSLPWTAVTCQIGDILQTVASHPSPTPQTVSSLLTSPSIMFKLVLLSFLSLAPILGRDHLRALLSSSEPVLPPTTTGTEEKQRASRWAVAWVQDWRTKIRMSSRSRTREASQMELHTLVDEKRAFEDLSS
ncbi:snare associated Golgi protein-domain-containing protein [Roridomyces roridus]|uniref:Snare associated Golgi protein-domain-containing protein n=1 Tax=Roridomyces roridus TaxID=1738132 RepID=A0AAD7C4V3_9AGAR|nr:snare associated Golgi protein-domain-containing protein [Roridomyces roridus]